MKNWTDLIVPYTNADKFEDYPRTYDDPHHKLYRQTHYLGKNNRVFVMFSFYSNDINDHNLIVASAKAFGGGIDA